MDDERRSSYEELERLVDKQTRLIGEQATLIGEQATLIGEQATLIGEQARLINEQAGMLDELRAADHGLESSVAELERIVGQNSGNSGKPPFAGLGSRAPAPGRGAAQEQEAAGGT